MTRHDYGKGTLTIGDREIPVIVTGVTREVIEKPVSPLGDKWKEYEAGPATYTVEEAGPTKIADPISSIGLSFLNLPPETQILKLADKLNDLIKLINEEELR